MIDTDRSRHRSTVDGVNQFVGTSFAGLIETMHKRLRM